MPIYIHSKGQQSGPYEERIIIDQLTNGLISPDDLGIRPGDAAWSNLGSLFPGVAASSFAQPAAVAHVAGSPQKKGNGCRVALGLTMLVIGLMMTIGGGGFAAATPFIYSMPLCPIAEEDYAKLDGLKKKYDAAKDTPEEYSAEFELKQAIDSYDSSSRMCAEERGTRQLFIIGGVVFAIVGLFAAIIGFFVRRVPRA